MSATTLTMGLIMGVDFNSKLSFNFQIVNQPFELSTTSSIFQDGFSFPTKSYSKPHHIATHQHFQRASCTKIFFVLSTIAHISWIYSLIYDLYFLTTFHVAEWAWAMLQKTEMKNAIGLDFGQFQQSSLSCACQQLLIKDWVLFCGMPNISKYI